MAQPRIAAPRFRLDDVKEPARLMRALNAMADDMYAQLMELRAGGFVSLLDDVKFRTGSALAIGTAPFPLRLRAPKSVRGAWVALLQRADTGAVSTNAAMAYVRPLGDGADAAANLQVDFITGLATDTEYTLRLAVLHG